MNQSAEIDQLAEALAAAQGEFQAVPKMADNPFFHSKYADLPSVVLAASPILAKYGIAVSQLPDFDGATDLLSTLIMHKSGQWISAAARLHLVKTDPQGQGSATTYMRRYAYSGGIGIVTDDDDDGNAASRPASPPRQTSRRSPPTAQEEPEPIPPESPSRRASPNKPASDKQLGMIKALGKQLDLTPQDLRAIIDTTVGRETDGWADLSSADASSVIDALKKAELDGPPPSFADEEPF